MNYKTERATASKNCQIMFLSRGLLLSPKASISIKAFFLHGWLDTSHSLNILKRLVLSDFPQKIQVQKGTAANSW